MNNRQQLNEDGRGEAVIPTLQARGGAIRDIAMGLLLLSRDKRHRSQVATVVLDTNIILKDLGHICNKGKSTVLFQEAEFGFVRLLITPNVAKEVSENIETYARNTGRDIKLMHDIWDEYRQQLFVVHPPSYNNERLEQLKQRDEDDIPTAILTETIGPTLTLSEDKDLKDFGYAQPDDWLDYVLDTRDMIDREAVLTSVTLGGSMVLQLILGAVKNGLKQLNRIPRQLWLLPAIAAAGVFAMPTTRKKLNQRISKWKKSALRQLPETSQAFRVTIAELEDFLQQGSKAEEYVRSATFQPHEFKSMYGAVLRLVGHSPYPLSIDEIKEDLQSLGHEEWGAVTEKKLHMLLTKQPNFRETENGTWKLVSV